MDENEITEKWYMRVNDIWYKENRALRISIKIIPIIRHGDKTNAKGSLLQLISVSGPGKSETNILGLSAKNLYKSDNEYIKRYVDIGISNYINGRYGAKSSVSSVVGYILSGIIINIISKLRNKIVMTAPHMNLKKDLSTMEKQYKSRHIRLLDGACITIHHLFFDFVV